MIHNVLINVHRILNVHKYIVRRNINNALMYIEK